MKKDVQKFVNNCKKCQVNKEKRRTRQPMVITTTSTKAFERVALDIVGPLPTSENGYTHILTLQDDLTKFSAAFPIKAIDATTVAKTFVEKFVCYFGIPNTVLSDQGSNFLSDIFKKMCKRLGIKKLQTTAYSPMSNGALERSHKTLKEFLRNFSDMKKNNWCEFICFAMYTYNTTPHTSHKFTPYELVFGIQPTIPSQLSKLNNNGYNYCNYVDDLRTRMQDARQIARKHLIEAKKKAKITYDKHVNVISIKVADKVLMKNMNKKKKLEPNWLGHFEVRIEINEPVNVTIIKNNKHVRVHMNHLKLYNEESD